MLYDIQATLQVEVFLKTVSELEVLVPSTGTHAFRQVVYSCQWESRVGWA